MNLVKILLSPNCMTTSLLQFTYRKMSKILMKWLQKPSPPPNTKPFSKLLIYFLSLLNVQPYQIILPLLIQYTLSHSSSYIHPSLFLPAFPNLFPFVKIGLKSNPRLKWLLASEPSGVLSFMWLISHTQQTLSHDLSSCVLSLSLTFKCLPLLLCPALSSLQVVDSDSKFLLQYLAWTLH